MFAIESKILAIVVGLIVFGKPPCFGDFSCTDCDLSWRRERGIGVIITFLVWDLFCLLRGVGIPAGFYLLSSGVVLPAVSRSRRDFYRLAL